MSTQLRRDVPKLESKAHHLSSMGYIAELPGVIHGYTRRTMTREYIQEQRRIFGDIRSRYPNGVGMFSTFLAEGIEIRQFADEALRSEFSKLATWMQPWMKYSAAMILGSGFIVATMRSAAVGLSGMSSRSTTRFFDDDATATDWLVTRVKEFYPRPPSAATLRAEVLELQRRADAAATGR